MITMHDPDFLSAIARALTLNERAAALPGADGAGSFDDALAAKRLQRWQLQPAFADVTGLFQQRLAQASLTYEHFGRLLGQTSQTMVNPEAAPTWAVRLTHAYADCATVEEDSKGFLTLFAPLICAARVRLRNDLIDHIASAKLDAPWSPPTVEPISLEKMLYAGVRPTLERMVARTLVLELNIARLQGELSGTTPAERFAAYIDQLHHPQTRRALLLEYPVLFRLVAAQLDTWVMASLELIQRLHDDWQLIRTSFVPNQEPGALTAIDWAQRSTKRGGRSVVVFSFASGFKIVYKPRSLAVECHFQALLRWLNEAGQQPGFRPLTLLDRGAYGWVEWIEAAPCTSRGEVRRFYQRQGAYLALLYALEATDFHLNNIIAAGEHPMLIDLEALFHPRDAKPDWPPLEQALAHLTDYSVLRLGLLPEPELSDDGVSTHFDLSGLAGSGDQQTPYTVPVWEERNTDAMRLVQRPTTISGGKNLPMLYGQPVDVVAYRAALDEGFTALYQLLIRRRADLLAEDGPLAAFANAEVRVVLRSGHHYTTILDESFHPDLLRDALDRDRYFDRLWQEVTDQPHLAQLIPYEQAALWEGDTPLFNTGADSCAVYSSWGECIPDFFPQSGLAAARQHIAALNESDLARQRWFIWASLATVPSAAHVSTSRPYALPTVAPPDLTQQLLHQATRSAEWLAEHAIRVGGEASWLGVVLVDDHHWLVEPLGVDLDNGLPGVTLFLAHLGAITGEARWTELAEAALATWRRYVAEASEAMDDDALPESDWATLGGQFYALAHLAQLWPQADLQPMVAALLAGVVATGGESTGKTHSSLAYARADLLTGLLALHQSNPTPEILHAACQVGDQLLHDHAPSVAGPLFVLTQASGDAQYAAAGQRLLAQGLPVEEATPALMLAYLRAWPWLSLVQQATLAQTLRTQLPALLAHNLGWNHSLGRGDLNYLDLTLYASAVLGDVELERLCLCYGAGLLADLQEHGWVSGVPLGVESPGLLAGLAGIGYGLLRLAAPQRVPSIGARALPGRGKG